MKTKVLLNGFLFYGIIGQGQDVKVDLAFTASFEGNESLKTEIKFNDLQLSNKDKEIFVKDFESKIKGSADYSNVYFTNTKDFYLNTNKDQLLFDGIYHTPHDGWKTPANYKDGFILDSIVVPAVDEKTGEEKVDKDGDVIYRTEYKKTQVNDVLYGILSNEKWIIEDKTFIKKPIFSKTLITVYNENNVLKGYKPSFDQVNSTKTKFKKNNLFKEDVSYTYFFTPSIIKSLNNKDGKVNDYEQRILLETQDGNFSSLHKNEYELLIQTIINQAVSGKLTVLNEKGTTILFDKSLIEWKAWDPKFDEELGDIALDEDGNAIYVEVAEQYSLRDFAGIQFVEDWYFDTEKVGVFKKVKTVKFLVYAYDEKGDMKGYKPLNFKVQFK